MTTGINLKKLEELEAESTEKSKEYSVLCVDDEIINTKTLRNLLGEYYNVYTALSAKEGIKILEKNKVDVIITDQRMPEIVGTDFLKYIMKHNLADNVRIILTGYTDISELIECINNGLIDTYLVKPWDEEELLKVVEASVEKIKAKREMKKIVPKSIVAKVFPHESSDS